MGGWAVVKLVEGTAMPTRKCGSDTRNFFEGKILFHEVTFEWKYILTYKQTFSREH